MNLIERSLRVMTHLNIGATLGLAAWLLSSGPDPSAATPRPEANGAQTAAMDDGPAEARP